MIVRKDKLGNWVMTIVITILGLIMIVPFIWMFLSAFKPPEEIMRVIPTFFPEQPTLKAFREIFALYSFSLYLRNSMIVSVTISCAVLFTSSLLGYCFAKFQFFGKDALFLLIIIMMIVPFEIMVVPLFTVVNSFGMVNTLASLIIPFIVEPFGIFLCTQFLKGIPSDLIDAARIDGLSEWGIYLKLIVPLIKPALSVLFLFIFLFQWGFVLWPLVVASSDKVKTVALGITELQTQRGFVYHQTLAAAVLTITPMLIVFFFVRRGIVRGLVLTGMKI